MGNNKMNQTNKMGINLVDNLRKQIEKYQNNDSFNINDNDDDDIDNWKSRYLSEKRTSEYLRAECEDLQNEIEELKENNDNNNKTSESVNNDQDDSELLEASLAIANQAWMEEITTLLEQFKNNNTNNYNLNDLRNEMQNLRRIIYNHNRNEVYKSLFDRIVRYHNLDGNEDTLFQLMIDAELN